VSGAGKGGARARRDAPIEVAQIREAAIHGRTLEVSVALRGLADSFDPGAVGGARAWAAHLSTPLDFSVFDTRFPFSTFCIKKRLRGLLEERALEWKLGP